MINKGSDQGKRGGSSTRACLECKAVIPPQKGSARPRKYCVACRPPRGRPNPRIINLPPPADVAEQPEDDLSLVGTYRQVLKTAGRLATPEGAHVMHLANLFANGEHTAAGAASLSRELRSAMESALQGAPKQADAMDEIAERRRRKMSSA